MPPLTLSAGTRLGPYEIVSALGAGGMGEVYRATDTRLKRQVAIKVLPAAVTADPDRLARFQREAEVLASLNHPNIAQIHGLEDADGVRALVMELVEGPTLADRLANGAIPIDEALPIAKQIAEALDAAHEQGIIHRDLKPANIKVREDGTVKVLDFGLAKAMEPARASSASAINSPTISMHATQAGIILGTAAYMSPEQARGGAVDKRADLWAFGVVLYEMLTGTRPFEGATISDTLAAVLKTEPQWAALPANTPAPIRRLLRRCLEKDRKQRLPDAADIRLEIADALTAPAADASPVTAPRRLAALPIASALAGGALVTALVMWVVMRPAPASPPQTIRFTIVPPPAQALAINGYDRDFALSPDGTHLVYVSRSAGGTQLMVRAFDQLDAVPLATINGIRSPFISPDGRWVGFFVGDVSGELKKVSIAGGASITLCKLQGPSRGGSWGPNGTIVFAVSALNANLLSVSEAGGEPKVLTKPDPAHPQEFRVSPSVLPGGRAVLFTITTLGSVANPQVAVLDLKTGRRKTLVRGGGYAEYVDSSTTSTSSGQASPGPGGHLVYAVAGTLHAVRFDPVKLEVLSDPVPVVEHVMTMANGAAEFSLSRQGALVYVPGGMSGVARSMVWVDRRGQEERIQAPSHRYTLPRLSPDGTQVALDIRDQDNDIWIWDLSRQTLRQLTFGPVPDWFPVWTPDGRHIIFASGRAGVGGLFWHAADNTGTVERLTASPNPQFPTSISPDGTRLIFWENMPNTGPDLKVLRMEIPAISSGGGVGSRQSEPLLQTTNMEHNGELSPDGRWLAYESNEPGQFQIYVRPFPNVDGGRWMISPSGGTKPMWARSGRELFHLDGTNAMTTVPVQTAPNFSYGNPTKLFDGRYYAAVPGRTYDVSPDGKRFLMIKEGAGGSDTSPAPAFIVVQNWTEELKRLVPTR